MGIVLDDIQGDINSINFNYSYDPIDSQISYLEGRIQQVLHAYDQFDALQAMGDRASAAESGMAVGAVAQGLSTHQNAIMQFYADVARQCIANRVAYSPNQEFPVTMNGKNSAITIQQMALEAIIDVKPALAKQIHERTIAANSLQLLGMYQGKISKSLEAYLMEQSMLGTMPRGVAESGILDAGPSQEEIQLAQQQAQNDAQILAQNQQMYENNPVQYETDNVMETRSPDEIDDVISTLNTEGQSNVEEQEAIMDNPRPEALDMMSQEGAMNPVGMPGMTAESGAEYANPNAMLG
jgi:hypothetical protein